MPVVSCIIPIYNCESVLRRALDSLVGQSFKDWEALCVDDASDDKSASIIECYCRRDERFKIIRQECNMGAAKARNTGLNMAKGEYVIFLDSDDMFYSCLLETLVERASHSKADLVTFGYEIEYVDSIYGKKRGEIETYHNYDKTVLGDRMIFSDLIRVKPCSWDKFIRKQLLDDNGIMFQEIKTNDDILFSYSVACSAQKILFISDILYKYYFGGQGSLTQETIKGNNNSIKAYIHTYYYVKKNKPKMAMEFLNYILDTFQYYFELDYSRQSLRSLEVQLKSEIDFMREIERLRNDERILAHNRFFLKSILDGEEIIEIKRGYYIQKALAELFRNNRDRTLVLWGCGKMGKEIIDFTNGLGLRLGYVVDLNEGKWGQSYGGYDVTSYDSIKGDDDLIIASNPLFLDSIKEKNVNKEVVAI